MMNKKRLKNLLIICTALIFAMGCKDDREMDERDMKLDSLSRELARYQRTSDSLKALLEKSSLAQDYPVLYGSTYATIENPEELIKSTLKKHPELIPLDPVLGGTMDYRQIKVLTQDWVLATYDDGHVQGKSIFEYKLQPDGSLIFKHIASRLPE